MLEEIITKGAGEMGLVLPGPAPGAFRRYYELLTARNREFNITAIEGEDAAAKLHFLDCAALTALWDFKGKSVIDVGSGGGFPGIPILICEPTVNLTMLDSTEKKVGFTREVCRELGFEAESLCGRAEELALEPEHRERYDAAVSRAVAKLNVLSELCLPFVRVGGVFIAMKSAASGEEVREAEGAIAALGGELAETREYAIPGTDIVRRAVIIRKTAPTGKKYPRRYGKIVKKPL